MSIVTDTIQSWLLSKRVVPLPLDELNSSLASGNQSELAKIRVARRFAKGLASFEDGSAGALDFAVLLRQLIRSLNRRFIIPGDLWAPIACLDERAGLQARVLETGESEVSALPWTPDWLPGSDEIDVLAPRRKYQKGL